MPSLSQLFALALVFAACGSVPTVTVAYSGANFINILTLLNGNVVYLDGQNLIGPSVQASMTLQNITEVKCSDSQQVCLVSTDFITQSWGYSTSPNALTKKDEYSVRSQTAYRMSSRTAPIEGSTYFLTSSLSKYGVIRWQYNVTQSYAQLQFAMVPDSLDTTDLLVFNRSRYAIVSYTGFNQLILLDFVGMSEIRRIAVTAGYLAPLDADPSLSYFVNSVGQSVYKLAYADGSIIGSLSLPYLVTGLRNVAGTDWVIVSGWQQFYIYNMAGTNTSTWSVNPYYFNTTGLSIGSLEFNQMSGAVIISGLMNISLVTDTVPAFCHPACTGCTAWLSQYQCVSCSANATSKGGQCVLSSITAPMGGAIDYSTASWSANTMTPPPAQSGFNLKNYYMYFVIGAGAVLGLCVLYCLYKMCCSDDNDMNNNNNSRVGNSRKDYDN